MPLGKTDLETRPKTRPASEARSEAKPREDRQASFARRYPARPGEPGCVRSFCLRILGAGDLDTKLLPPTTAEGSWLPDTAPGPSVTIERPARGPGLAMHGGSERLPPPRALATSRARALCLARFAHHELMAVELFAFALLRWPDAPKAMRGGWLHILRDEQLHCRLYLSRLAAHGSSLAQHRHSDYFWRHAGTIAASPHGARAFLSAMGLTLEQANLDFTLLYRDAFRIAGDEASAGVCQRVHDDELRHVRHAARWLRRLSPPEHDATRAYDEAVPFPFAASRAKGRRFDARARRRAGLDPAFIEHVRVARSTQQTRRPRSAPESLD